MYVCISSWKGWPGWHEAFADHRYELQHARWATIWTGKELYFEIDYPSL